MGIDADTTAEESLKSERRMVHEEHEIHEL
jgi:hypothetical protein